MAESIVKYGKLSSEKFDQPDEIKDYLYEVATDYGFVNVDLNPEMDVEAGIIAPTGDALSLNPNYIENNALTYLDPELMNRKIETEVEFIRGTYESGLNLGEAVNREELLDNLNRQITELQHQRSEDLMKSSGGEFSEDEVVERAQEIDEELNRLQSKADIVNRAESSQGMLYMINEEMKKGNDPVEAIAVNQYNPSMFSKDSLEGYFEFRFGEDFPWLNEDARTQVIETVDDINDRLERQAEQFKH